MACAGPTPFNFVSGRQWQRMPDDWSAEETDDPRYADRRNFYKVDKRNGGVKGADMKIIVAAAVLSISLCGCSAYTDRSIHRNLVGPTVVGDGNAVLVSHVRNQTDGQPLPKKHCKRFGKIARFNRMEGTRAFFDCQSPS
jgi:hypothetical protein